MADDIVERIRKNLPSIEWEQPLAAERERLAADEIKRLRAAGDEMAKLILAELPLSLNEENFKVWFSVVKWWEARRG